MIREQYKTYDQIWVEGIQITPELEATGLIGKINAKMPNLLMRKSEKLEIGAMAQKYGFADGQALATYLAAYEPRKKYEDALYSRLLAEKMQAAPAAERNLALAKTSAELQACLKHCQEQAKDIVSQAYAKYDEIWYGRIRITPALQKHGADVISEINRKMPNLLTHNPLCSAIDQVAMEQHFETDQDLVDYLLDYKPRFAWQDSICEDLAREALGLVDEEIEIDEVPF